MTDELDAVLTEAVRFDDAALQHLANKGLLRRGAKLAGGDSVVEATDAGCTVTGEGWSVEFDESKPLQDAHCGCSTAGVCQHIIGAIVVLRELADDNTITAGNSEEAEVEIAAAILELSDEDFLKWTKKTDARWAASRLESIAPTHVIIESGAALRVELPSPHAAVNFMGTSLENAVVKPSTRHDRRAVALAVLALWQTNGRLFEAPETATSPTNELRSERAVVLQRTMRVATDMLAIGLLHVGESEAERLGSLGASLRGVRLYRLAVLSERAADQVDSMIALDVAASPQRLFQQMAEMNAVAEATATRIATNQALPEGLIGIARSSYSAVGQLELVGLGHYPWGDDRFAGTTTVASASATESYSVSSPNMANGRSIQTQTWAGIGLPQAVAGHRFILANAQASGSQRLSPTAKSTATLAGPITDADLASLQWDGRTPATGSKLLGSANTGWVVVRVETHEEAFFDEAAQELFWRISSAGAEVNVRLPYRKHSERSVETLLSLLSRTTPSFVSGRLRAAAGGLELWPISVMTDGNFVNLAQPQQAAQHDPPETTSESGSAERTDQSEERLAWLEDDLIRLTESGMRSTTVEAMGELSSRCSSAGLQTLSAIIDTATAPSQALLRARWALTLARELT